MAFTIAAAASLAGGLILFEGLSALIDHLAGDPEADVAIALQTLAAKNQRRAIGQMVNEVQFEEDLQADFSKFNRIPTRMMSQAAFNQMPAPSIHRDTSLLDGISAQLGLDSGALAKASAPTRMGDMSSIYRDQGATPPGV